MKLARVPTSQIETANDFPLTDAGNMEFFAQECDRRVCRDWARGQWFLFGRHHWAPDTTGAVIQLALESVRQRQREAVNTVDQDARKRALQWTTQSENNSRLRDLLRLAESHPDLRTDGLQWDQAQMLFAVQNGVVDLELGTCRNGLTVDNLTKVSPVTFDPDATCLRFERFLCEVFEGEPDLPAYLQRVLGYTLTGVTSEQVFWILSGSGANGKSTLMETVMRAVFGILDYAWTMPFPTAEWSMSISEYQRAALVGRRCVSASEVARRGRLHEDFIKSLTGDDMLQGRHPYGRPFQFQPVSKFFLRVNEKPLIRDLSHSMWRRVKLIPFSQQFAVDTTLASTLAAEAPGILNWMIRGCRDWQRDGLQEPAIVSTATQGYRAESDVLTEFLSERCLVADGVSVGGSELYAAFKAWAHERPDEERLSQTAFGLRIKEQFQDIGNGRKVRYSGVALVEGAR